MGNKTINVKEILADIKAGMDDAALKDKYQLSAQQLKTVFEELVKNGSLQVTELYNREPAGEKPPTTKWECPVCHAPLNNEFEVCAKCCNRILPGHQDSPDSVIVLEHRLFVSLAAQRDRLWYYTFISREESDTTAP